VKLQPGGQAGKRPPGWILNSSRSYSLMTTIQYGRRYDTVGTMQIYLFLVYAPPMVAHV
jgi:hypothetical protein